MSKFFSILKLRLIKYALVSPYLLKLLFRFPSSVAINDRSYIYEYLVEAGHLDCGLQEKIKLNKFLNKVGLIRLQTMDKLWNKEQCINLLSQCHVDNRCRRLLNEHSVVLMLHPCDRWSSLFAICTAIEAQIIIPIHGDLAETQKIVDLLFPPGKVTLVDTRDKNAIFQIRTSLVNNTKLLIFSDLPSRNMQSIYGRTKEIVLFNRKAFLQYGPFWICSKFVSSTLFVCTHPVGLNNARVDCTDSIFFKSSNDLMNQFVLYFQETILKTPESVSYLPRLPSYHYQPTSPYDDLNNPNILNQ